MKCENIREEPRDELLACRWKIASIPNLRASIAIGEQPDQLSLLGIYWEGHQYSTPRLVPLHSFAFFFHQAQPWFFRLAS